MDWIWEQDAGGELGREQWAESVGRQLAEGRAILCDASDAGLIAAATLSAVVIRTTHDGDQGVSLWDLVAGGRERWRLFVRLSQHWEGPLDLCWAATALIDDNTPGQ